MDIKEIRLDQLEVDKANARRHPSDGIEGLAGSIASAGLINPLTVIENGAGKFHVIAGQRRLMALRLLGTDDRMVPCNVVDNNAKLISLSENVMRVPMHMVDEFRAYAELGKTMEIEEIASAFGISPHRVRQRLDLGNLAPAVLKALEDNKIVPRLAEDLCLTTDHKRQTSLMKKHQGAYYHGEVKAILLEKKFPAKAAIFDQKSYTGELTHDLFGMMEDAADGYFNDFEQALTLQGSATENLRADLEDEGWKWVEIWPSITTYTDLMPYEVEIPEESWSKSGQRSTHKYTKKEKAGLGCIVFWNTNYKVNTLKGVLSIEDKKAAAKEKRTEERADKAPVEPGSSATYSNAFSMDLENMRTAGAVLALTGNPSLVKRIAVANLLAVAGNEWIQKTMAVKAEAYQMTDFTVGEMDEHDLRLASDTTFADIEHVMALLDEKDRNPDTLLIKLSDIKQFTDEDIDKALCWFLAGALDTSKAPWTYRQIASECKIDWRAGWTPDHNFFSRLSKPQMEFILEEIGTPEVIVKEQMTLKRSDLQERMTGIFRQPEELAKIIGVSKAAGWIKAVNTWKPEMFREIQGD